MRTDEVVPPPRALLCISSNQVQLPNVGVTIIGRVVLLATTLVAGPVGGRGTGITGARLVPVGGTILVGVPTGTGCRGGRTGAFAVVGAGWATVVVVVVVVGDATGVRGGGTKLVGVDGAGKGLQPVFQLLALVVVLGADGGIAGEGGATGAVGVVLGAAGIAHRGAHGSRTPPAVTVEPPVLPVGAGPVGVVPERQLPGCVVHGGTWDGVWTNGNPAATHWDTPRAL
jgi:hypothetical protein